MTRSPRQKLLLVSEIFPPVHGGSGRWFSEIYGRFPKGRVAFLVGAHEQAGAYDSVSVHPIYRDNLSSSEWGVKSWAGLKFYLSTWRRMRHIVRRESISEVHCGRVLPEGVAALMLKVTNRVPYCCYVHGEDVETALSSRELTWLTRLVMKHAVKIICNSENSRRILKDKWRLPDEKILVMNPGVDVDRFTPDSGTPRPADWKRRLVILTVGRLQKRKGQDMMIRALPILRESFPDLMYAIVGGGQELEPLKKLVHETGVSEYVLFMGEVDDQTMVDAYRHCTLFALPNRRVGNDDEGFGMVLLEAQACGRPVLAGAAGGTRETLVDGRTGALVDCTSPESLAAAVKGLLSNPENLEAMGRAGRHHVVETFSWSTLASSAQQVFLGGNAEGRDNRDEDILRG